MTDEEKLAEEYTKTNVLKGLSYRQITETYDEISGYPYFLEDKVKQSFFAGLKAGRPKWHKVADGDLPPEDTDVLALLADKEIYMAHFYRRNVWDKIGPVVAWCEIPQYTEE